jgi:hypothetical protein
VLSQVGPGSPINEERGEREVGISCGTGLDAAAGIPFTSWRFDLPEANFCTLKESRLVKFVGAAQVAFGGGPPFVGVGDYRGRIKDVKPMIDVKGTFEGEADDSEVDEGIRVFSSNRSGNKVSLVVLVVSSMKLLGAVSTTNDARYVWVGHPESKGFSFSTSGAVSASNVAVINVRYRVKKEKSMCWKQLESNETENEMVGVIEPQEVKFWSSLILWISRSGMVWETCDILEYH